MFDGGVYQRRPDHVQHGARVLVCEIAAARRRATVATSIPSASAKISADWTSGDARTPLSAATALLRKATRSARGDLIGRRHIRACCWLRVSWGRNSNSPLATPSSEQRRQLCVSVILGDPDSNDPGGSERISTAASVSRRPIPAASATSKSVSQPPDCSRRTSSEAPGRWLALAEQSSSHCPRLKREERDFRAASRFSLHVEMSGIAGLAAMPNEMKRALGFDFARERMPAPRDRRIVNCVPWLAGARLVETRAAPHAPAR